MPKDKNAAMLDKDVERNRALRTTLGITILGTIVFVVVSVGLGFGPIGVIVSLSVAGLLVAAVIPWVTVQVPYTWGLVAENSFTGNPVVYGSGWHFRYPWETITEESNIDLRERTRIFEGLTIASKSDELKVKISFQWKPDLMNLATFRRMDDSTIESGFFEPIERFVSSSFAGMTADEARESQSVLSRLILAAFRGNVDEAIGNIPSTHDRREELEREEKLFAGEVGGLEEGFGIKVVQVNVSDVDFSEEVRKARAAVAEHKSLERVCHQIAGSKEAFEALSPQAKADIRAEARVITGNATERQLNLRGNRPSGGLILSADEK
jgi:regulator of protease activity HflC (stomatin/prohibitin superfamily)